VVLEPPPQKGKIPYNLAGSKRTHEQALGEQALVTGRSLNGTITGDTVSLTGGTATFDNENVGTGKTVTLTGASLDGADKGNYNLTSVGTAKADITPLGITGNFTASNKVYDGNNSATVTGRSLNGTVSGDTVSLTGGTATFDNKNVGTGKTVTLSGASLDGVDKGNYNLTSVNSAKADITAKDITGSFAADNKVYDGNNSATIASRSLQGVVGSEDVSLTGATATFDNKNVGTGKTVTATGFTLGGADKGNYTLKAGPWTATANITPKPLTVTAEDKTKFLRGADPTFTVRYSEFATGESPSVLGGALQFSTNVPNPEQVGKWEITPSGLTSSNYNITFVKGAFTITYKFAGFLQPINYTAHQSTTSTDVSTFKAGSTVPVRFQITDANGNVVQGAKAEWLTPVKGSSTTQPVDEDFYSDPATTGTLYLYNSAGNHYHYNWNTKGQSAGFYYRIGVRLDDGQTYYVNISLR
jgi:hypothetical protein